MYSQKTQQPSLASLYLHPSFWVRASVHSSKRSPRRPDQPKTAPGTPEGNVVSRWWGHPYEYPPRPRRAERLPITKTDPAGSWGSTVPNYPAAAAAGDVPPIHRPTMLASWGRLGSHDPPQPLNPSSWRFYPRGPARHKADGAAHPSFLISCYYAHTLTGPGLSGYAPHLVFGASRSRKLLVLFRGFWPAPAEHN